MKRPRQACKLPNIDEGATVEHMAMKKIWGHPLGRELLVILVVKVILLFAIWWIFFSHPEDHALSPEQVSRAILESKAVSTKHQGAIP